MAWPTKQGLVIHHQAALPKSFESDATFQIMLKAGKSRRVARQRWPPFAKRWVASKPQVGNLSMPIKDAEDQRMKIFHRTGTQLMEDASHFHAIIGVRRASILGRNLQAVRCL